MSDTRSTPFKAFVSYSHAADSRLAPALQSALRRVGKPWYRLPFRVFLDKSSMSPPVLWPAIEGALSRSAYFVLLASTESARSPWVSKEIEWWIEHRSLDTFIIVVTDGEIAWDAGAGDFDWTRSTALNTCMRGKFRHEPLFVDLRSARMEAHLSLRHPRFRAAVLDIASTLHGVPRDTLDDEDARQSRLARRLATGAIVGLAGLSVAAGIAAYVARRAQLDERAQRNLAQCRQVAAQSASQLDQRLDLALLLAAEAQQIYPCPEISSALLAALHHEPRLIGILEMPSPGSSPEAGGNVTTDVAFSPDGRLLAATSWLGGQVWDAATKRPVGPALDAHYGLAITPDGRTLVATDGDNAIRFWEISTGVMRGQGLTGPPSLLSAIGISPDATLLAGSAEPTGTEPARVYLWDMVSRRPVGTPLAGYRLAFSPDGRTLATSDEDLKSIVLWDIETRRPRQRALEGHSGTLRALEFSPDGARLASGGADNLVIVWDLETRTGQRLTAHAGPVNRVAFSHDGQRLATAGGDGRVILWDGETLRPVGPPLAAAAGPVFDVAFSPDDTVLASTGGDERVLLWSLESDLPIGRSFPVPMASGSDVAISPDGRTAAFVDTYAKVILWDLTTGQQRASFGSRVTAVDFSPDGTRLASVSRNGVLSLWDVRAAEPVGSAFTLSDRRFWSVRFSPDGRRIAIGGDAVLLIWDVATRKVIAPPRHEQKDRIWSVAFSPDGRLLASGGNESLRLWSLGNEWTSEEIPVGPFKGLVPTDVAFSPDGSLLAYRDGERSVTIRGLVSRQVVHARLSRERGMVTSLAFSRDATRLVVGGSDGAIVVWDTATGRQIGPPIQGHDEDDIDALAFAPDGETFISLSAKKMIVWDARADAWVRTGCRIANRSLTPAEWTRYFGVVPYRPVCRF